jgi:uncharacterized oxidoreductase
MLHHGQTIFKKGSIMSDTYYFRPDRLQKAMFDLCRASGSPDKEADLVSRRLIESDLSGHPSHGILRIPLYMRLVRRDMIKPGATPEIIKDNGSIAVVSGNGSYGQVGADYAMSVAIEKAKANGIAAVGVINLSHIGRLSDYAVSASDSGCIGMVFTSGGGAGELVAPFEGSSRRMATNPMAVGIPGNRKHPVVFDMATSTWAEGKFRMLRALGQPSPENTLIDKQGRPTTDVEDFYGGGAILPLGGKQGYKGYLLNFMVEVLAGILTGGGFLGRDEEPAFNNCTMMIVIDVARFRKLPGFKADLDKMIDYLKESPVLEGNEVIYPGEIEERKQEEIRAAGVSVATRTLTRLQEEMDRYNVPVRLDEMGQLSPLS